MKKDPTLTFIGGLVIGSILSGLFFFALGTQYAAALLSTI